jgi:hypothetical protein
MTAVVRRNFIQIVSGGKYCELIGLSTRLADTDLSYILHLWRSVSNTAVRESENL